MNNETQEQLEFFEQLDPSIYDWIMQTDRIMQNANGLWYFYDEAYHINGQYALRSLAEIAQSVYFAWNNKELTFKDSSVITILLRCDFRPLIKKGI